MIYAFEIICAPRYPFVIVACSGFKEWSDTSAVFMDYRVYDKESLHGSWDNWSYLKKFLESAQLPDIETLIVDSYYETLSKQLYDYYDGKYIVIHAEEYLFKTILGDAEETLEERKKAMVQGKSAFKLLEELKVFTRQAIQQTISTDIATRLARFKAPLRFFKPFDRVFIQAKEFSQVEELHQIEIPADIKYFYEHVGAPENDFHREIRRLCTEGSKASLIVQINASFAMAIIEAYKALTADEKADLKHQVEKLDIHNELQRSPNMLSYLLSEGIDHYDFGEDAFRIPVIQTARSKVIADKPYFNVVLFLWAHCGGWGGIVLRGEHPSYDGGGTHGEEYLEVASEGEIFEYRSIPVHLMDTHHLFEYRDLIVTR
ncbi:hypothetical protein [Chitinophaga sp. CF418]|uniref:hypothetical protein n=1 Tax=Chitinophaga sp. CF418 TaxID=1855287 RepID=UPI0009198BC5|nr:hypothetical protein [Chitinophaga sp. CF418]SHN43968.1 hypothetical protein SAMN05216311_116149 [Chitinophaga sp. CF418]